jgi:hypothetical protein
MGQYRLCFRRAEHSRSVWYTFDSDSVKRSTLARLRPERLVGDFPRTLRRVLPIVVVVPEGV